jgi:hypothetical protein
MLLVTAIYTAPMGIFSLGSWSVVPFLMGLLIYIFLVNSIEFYLEFEDIVKYSLILASVAIFTQFGYYLVSGQMINLAIFASEVETRSNFGGLIMRPTGFFIEPGSHALATVNLLMIYLTLKNYKFDFLALCATISVFLSMSLAGFLVLLLAFTVLSVRTLGRGGVRFGVGLALTILGLIVLAPGWLVDAIGLVFFERLDTILVGSDGSANDRLGKLNFDCLQYIYAQNPYGLIFGNGLSSDAFTAQCGANNLSWAIYNYGAVISLLFVFRVFWRFRNAPLIFLSLVYIAMSSQLSSYAFSWLYFACLFGPLARRLDQGLESIEFSNNGRNAGGSRSELHSKVVS